LLLLEAIASIKKSNCLRKEAIAFWRSFEMDNYKKSDKEAP
jgi:hypothetical protein